MQKNDLNPLGQFPHSCMHRRHTAGCLETHGNSLKFQHCEQFKIVVMVLVYGNWRKFYIPVLHQSHHRSDPHCLKRTSLQLQTQQILSAATSAASAVAAAAATTAASAAATTGTAAHLYHKLLSLL